MKPHIQRAHAIWREHVKQDDTVIDATCGNGHDTLILAELTPQGKVYACDVQPEAIAATRRRLANFSHITYIEGCHSNLPEVEPSLIVYNLGYLPGGDKEKTTCTATTLKSIGQAIAILRPGGLISITLYPGHPEGAIETKAILNHIARLPYTLIEPSERQTAPKLLLLRPKPVL